MALAASTTTAERDAAARPPSVLRSMNEVNRRLEKLLMDMRAQSAADALLRTLANDVISAVERDPDIALACIYLNQIAGIYAVRHCVETAIVAVIVGRAMGKTPDEVQTIAAAALTMNVGMVQQSERFQHKGSDLTAEDRSIIQRHPAESADLLRCAGIEDRNWLEYVLLHHESEDGTGYPEGRHGNEIPENAKLIGLADKYCACVSARNYRRSMLPYLALQNLCVEAQAPIDAQLAGAFIAQVGKYPPGSLVRLQNGEVGVVMRRLDSAGTIQVAALRSQEGTPLSPPAIRRSNEPHCAVENALAEDEAGLRFSMKNIWGELATI